MKVALVFLLAASSLLSAQTQPANPRAACGNGELPFTVKLDNVAPESPTPEPGKALVFFVQDGAEALAVGYPTTNIAMDGVWVGANKKSSYTALTLDPGEHHACVMVQSSLYDSTELMHLNAEAGKTYYYRTRLLSGRGAEYLELAPIDSDQGWFLVNSYPRSITKPKK